jgi:4-amino-4-deoxy-L-arabinose transferase-like glycosyltransferase
VDTPEPTHQRTPPRSLWPEVGAWLTALVAASLLLTWLHLRTRDPDSRLHVEIAQRLAHEPVTRWIAPEWWGLWRSQGLFREHPAGIFWLPAALTRLGYPGGEAAYLANALYQALTLVVLARLAAAVVTPLEARALTWLLQLIPIAFAYRIRANHEQLVLLCLLAALLGTERSLARARWAGLAAAACACLALVKGVFVIFGPLACGLWLLLRGETVDSRQRARAWLGLLVALGAIGLTAVFYEWGYRSVTGQPFLAVYLGRQLGVAAQAHSDDWLAQKGLNLFWYLGRVLFFPLPFSVVALVVAWKKRSDLARLARLGAGSLVGTDGRALAFALLLSGVYVAAFSLSDRKADRYIFPVYFLVAAVGAVACLRASPRLHALAERIDRLGAWVTPAVWLVAFALHPVAGWLSLPTVKIWPSD